MLILTTLTTFISGLTMADPDLPTLSRIMEALTFPAALLCILMAHEMGHFLACRVHGLDATLPLFIPGPPFPIGIGTFGAFIRIRSPIRDRRQLLDVGAAGPLAGMMLAVPLTIAGLLISEVGPLPTGGGFNLQFGESLLFAGLRTIIFGSLPAGQDVFLHPIALAGWLGLFVTSLNLIAAGQLDGGHVVHALFGRAHGFISRAIFLILVWWGVLGDFYFVTSWQVPLAAAICLWSVVLCLRPVRRKLDRNVFLVLLAAQVVMQMTFEIESASTLWLVWGLLVYLFGLDHPPVRDFDQPLTWTRWVVGVLCLVIFLSTFLPLPLKVV